MAKTIFILIIVFFISLFSVFAYTVSESVIGYWAMNETNALGCGTAYDYNPSNPNRFDAAETGTVECVTTGIPNGTQSSRVWDNTGGKYLETSSSYAHIAPFRSGTQAGTRCSFAMSEDSGDLDTIWSSDDSGGGNYFPTRFRMDMSPKVVGWEQSIGSYSTTAMVAGTWYYICNTWDSSNMNTYINGVLENFTYPSIFPTTATASGTTLFGIHGAKSVHSHDGAITEAFALNVTLNASDINYTYLEYMANKNGFLALYNEYFTILEAPPPPEFFSLKATDIYNTTSLQTFNATISNASWSLTNYTTDGVMEVYDLNGTFDIQVWADGNYILEEYTDQYIQSGTQFIANVTQSIITFNATKKVSGTELLNYTVYAPLSSNSTITGSGILKLSQGNYNISLLGESDFYGIAPVSVSPLDEKTESFNVTNVNLTIHAKDFFTNGSIQNFEINITNDDYSFYTNGTGNSNITFELEQFPTSNYTVEIIADDYEYNATNLILDNTTEEHTFYLRPENSIFITIYDANTSNILQPNTVSIDAQTNFSITTKTTNNGTLMFTDLDVGEFEIIVSSDGYGTRSFFATLESKSSIGLTAYLLPEASGTYINFLTINLQSIAIDNALYTIARRFNSSYVTVEQKYSDFSGIARVFLDQDKRYRITISKTGFDTKVIEIQPTNPPYTVIMSSGTSQILQPLFLDIEYITQPSGNVINSEMTNFSLITSSIGGTIEHFGVNATLWGTNYIENITGSISGGSAILELNLSNVTGTLNVDYFIKAQNRDLFVLHKTFYTSSIEQTNYSAITIFTNADIEYSSPLVKQVIAVFGSAGAMLVFGIFGVPSAAVSLIGVLALSIFAWFEWIGLTLTFIAASLLIGGYLLFSD